MYIPNHISPLSLSLSPGDASVMSVRVMVVLSSPPRTERSRNRSSLPPIFFVYACLSIIRITLFTVKDPALDTGLCLTKDIELLNVVS